MDNIGEGRWLLLIHKIPPKPSYFRIKIWRRLQRLGTVAIKNSVYVLPKNDQTQEDLQWALREMVAGGREASLCQARFVEGLSDDQVEVSSSLRAPLNMARLLRKPVVLAGFPCRKGPIEGGRRTQAEVNSKSGACDVFDGSSFKPIKSIKFSDDADNI